MESYCGIDVSLEQSSVCVVDATGSIMREATVARAPDALIAWLSGLDVTLSRIGLEAGPLSPWLYAGLATFGIAVELLELTVASAIDDPKRFRRSKQVGAHFGMTPKRYQSGEKDVSGRISKIGDRSVRTVLYEAANIMLTKPVKAGALKSWAMRLAARTGMKKAKVALARKLAVILHRMLVDGTPFVADKAAMIRG